MKVTFFGTTVLLFDDGRDQILFDAGLTRPSLLRCGFGKLKTNKKLVDRIIREYKIDRLRAVFVSHTHMDHVLDAPYIAVKTGASLYGSASALNAARGGEVPEENLFDFSESMEYRIGSFDITVFPSRHSKPGRFNNDLGQTIDRPLKQPARMRDYKEGGSFDFVVRHGGKTYLIRPSCNYIEGQLDGIRADVLFLGIGGLSKRDTAFRDRFFEETIAKTDPETVIPVHWDDFFKPLNTKNYLFPAFMDDTRSAFKALSGYCSDRRVECVIQRPLTSMEI